MSQAVSSEMLVHVQVEFGAQVEVEESIDEQQQRQDGRQHQENIPDPESTPLGICLLLCGLQDRLGLFVVLFANLFAVLIHL